MSFTDDDLARLKFSLGTLYIPTLNPIILDALIARLEAAEAIVTFCDKVPHTQSDSLKEAWRKVAGK